MRITNALSLLSILSPILSLAACVSDETTAGGDDDLSDLPDDYADSVIVQAQAVPSVFGSSYYGGGLGNQVAVMSEKGADHTCFLLGISGSMDGTNGYANQEVYAKASVELNPTTDNWEIHTRSGYGKGVWAHVSCIYDTHVANRRFLAKSGNSGAGNDAPITTKRRCMMTGITAWGDAMMWRRDDGYLPGAEAWTYGGSWRIGSFLIGTTDGHSAGHTDAVCFDISGAGETGDFYYEGATTTINTATDTSNWACGAWGVWGVMGGSATTIGTAGFAKVYKGNNSEWYGGGTANRAVSARCWY